MENGAPAGVHEIRPVEARTLRQVCGNFVTGVTVITSELEGLQAGTTVNSFTSVSLEPPLVLICLHEQSRLGDMVRRSGRFVVNFLTGRQERVAWAFAAKETAVLGDVAHHGSGTAGPILSDALAFLACRLVDEFSGGDHRIFLGEVTQLGVHREDEPLVFFRGSMSALEPVAAAAHPIWDG
ncbi:MAG TPA: flavin reductase family protein [Mycobacteriales bacterium]|nr:flavin reductase family protein [Mycobacteriales bacterium]